MQTEHGKTYISSGILLPSRVTHLVIKRPPHFCFRPGDYVFVNIPSIAKYEWHPFTLSSAPEQDDHIWLHIRGVGEWTNRLYRFFEKEQEKLQNGEIAPLVGRKSDAAVTLTKLAQQHPPPKFMQKSNSFESALNKTGKKDRPKQEISKLALEPTNEPVKPERAKKMQG